MPPRLRPAAAAADPDDDAWIRNPSSAGASVPEGLSSRTLRALPHVVFESRGGTIVRGGGSECAVCLADFEPGEELVRLPRCGHFSIAGAFRLAGGVTAGVRSVERRWTRCMQTITGTQT